MTDLQPSINVHNLIGYMTYTGYVSDRELYCSKSEDQPPVLWSIRGPGGGRHSGIDTLHGSIETSGTAGPYNALKQRVWQLNPELFMCSIGRARGQHIQIETDTISKFHASIVRQLGREWTIKDAESSNGTAVIKYASPTFEENLQTEQYDPIPSGDSRQLEDRLVIEVGGKEHGTRLIFFSDPGSIHDFYTSTMRRS